MGSSRVMALPTNGGLCLTTCLLVSPLKGRPVRKSPFIPRRLAMDTVAHPVARPSMKLIDEHRLETDLPYRVQYLTEFMGITPDDWAVIQESGRVLGPVVDALVDAVYDQLWK